jgi:glutaredoxin-related protein
MDRIEKAREYKKKWNEANKEKLREYSKKAYYKNKDKIVEKKKQYQDENMDRTLENSRLRRRRKRQKLIDEADAILEEIDKVIVNVNDKDILKEYRKVKQFYELRKGEKTLSKIKEIKEKVIPPSSSSLILTDIQHQEVSENEPECYRPNPHP